MMRYTTNANSRMHRTLSLLLVLALLSNNAGLVLAEQTAGPSPETRCDELAAHPEDVGRRGPGVEFSKIAVADALPACRDAAERPGAHPRYQYQYGRVLSAAKRLDEALRQFVQAAATGYAQAMSNVGFAYFNGEGAPKDDVEAVRWYRKAVEAGSVTGMRNLGYMYGNGRGVGKDEAEAVRWYRKAAEAGESTAMTNLAHMYLNGRGVGKDDAEAARWYRKASEAGHPIAMRLLGISYATGNGVARNDAEAARWFGLAAERDDDWARLFLADAYSSGLGVRKNPDVARSLYSRLSASRDSNMATRAKEGLRKLDEGESSAGAWLAAAAVVVGLAILLSGEGSAEEPAQRGTDSDDYMRNYAENARRQTACLQQGKTWYVGAGCF